MKLDHLKTFLTAADCLSFTQAARVLHLSQPAVSQQIRELEDNLGVILFDRRKRGILLTSAGEMLHRRATEVLNEISHVERELQRFKGTPQGVLRVGASNIPGLYVLPRAIGQYAATAPGVRVSMTIHPHDALINALHNGELDMVVTQDEPSAARIHGWKKTALLEDELVLIAWPAHPLAGQGPHPVTALLEHDFIARQQGSATDQLVLDRLAEAGLNAGALSPRFELAHPEGIKQAVMAKLGLGFVSRHAVQVELAAGMLCEVPLAGVRIVRTHWLLHPDEAMPEHFEAFRDVLLSQAWRPATLG